MLWCTQDMTDATRLFRHSGGLGRCARVPAPSGSKQGANAAINEPALPTNHNGCDIGPFFKLFHVRPEARAAHSAVEHGASHISWLSDCSAPIPPIDDFGPAVIFPSGICDEQSVAFSSRPAAFCLTKK